MDEIKKGEKPSDEDLRWLKYGEDIQKESLKILSDQSKELVTLSSSLIVIYTGGLTLFGLPEKVSSFGLLILTIPIILWLICIYYSANINFPEVHQIYINSPTEMKKFIKNEIDEKYSKLKKGRYLFIVSIALSALLLILMNTPTMQKSEPQNVQFVIAQDFMPEFKNTSIPLNEALGITVPIKLIKLSDQSYTVETPNGSIVQLDDDLVKGIIFS
jgi:hypothetical protein